MASMQIDPIVAWILRVCLAALFATAALHKVREPRAFAATIADYRLLPAVLVAPAAIGLVGVEGFLTLAFLLETEHPAVGGVAATLLALYALAIALNLARGRREIDCGCLGPAGAQSLSPGLVVRNLALAAVALATTLPLAPRVLHWIDGASLIGGVLVLGLLFQAVNTLAAQTWAWPEQENAS
jgi:uncharacterized membrane protein YphA (DoxX/SURF4 family)